MTIQSATFIAAPKHADGTFHQIAVDISRTTDLTTGLSCVRVAINNVTQYEPSADWVNNPQFSRDEDVRGLARKIFGEDVGEAEWMIAGLVKTLRQFS